MQLLEFPYGNGMEVVFGGGRRELMHKNQTDPEYPDKKGERLDGRDVISEWVNKFQNSKYVWNKSEFDQIDVDKVDHVIGMKFFIYTCSFENRVSKTNQLILQLGNFKTTKIIQRLIKSLYLTPGSKLAVPCNISTRPNLKWLKF